MQTLTVFQEKTRPDSTILNFVDNHMKNLSLGEINSESLHKYVLEYFLSAKYFISVSSDLRLLIELDDMPAEFMQKIFSHLNSIALHSDSKKLLFGLIAEYNHRSLLHEFSNKGDH